MSVLDTFKRLVQEEVVDIVTIDGKISGKDKKVVDAVNTMVDEASGFFEVVDALKHDNMMDEADLFRILVDAIEEEGA